ncbi:MAG TPA: hypothetical protein PKN41_06445 [Bacteroidales bacterium]|nr:hypothetical protein [Bacteroidales bacterium]
MGFEKIDISLSKEKERVVRKPHLLEKLIDFLAYFALIGAYPILSGMYIINQLKKSESIIGPVILFILFLGLSCLLLYSLLTLDKLQRIKGTTKDKNRNIIKEIAEELGWNIKLDDNDITIAAQTSNAFSTNWGRQILILYDAQDILINCTAFSLSDLKSPFHWLGNRVLEQKIKDEFKKRVDTTTP